MLIVHHLKTKEIRLTLTNQLIAQLDIRADGLKRQKATLKMCRQDTAPIDEQLRYGRDAYTTSMATRKKLQAEFAAYIGAY